MSRFRTRQDKNSLLTVTLVQLLKRTSLTPLHPLPSSLSLTPPREKKRARLQKKVLIGVYFYAPTYGRNHLPLSGFLSAGKGARLFVAQPLEGECDWIFQTSLPSFEKLPGCTRKKGDWLAELPIKCWCLLTQKVAAEPL